MFVCVCVCVGGGGGDGRGWQQRWEGAFGCTGAPRPERCAVVGIGGVK